MVRLCISEWFSCGSCLKLNWFRVLVVWNCVWCSCELNFFCLCWVILLLISKVRKLV